MLRCLSTFVLAAGVFGAVLGFSTPEAHAQSQTCKRLESQLASVGRGGNKRIRKAIRGQERQIARAIGQMRQRGCSPRKRFLRRDAHPTCAPLRNAIRKMRGNIASLQRQGGGSASAQRASIKRAMRRNRCGVADRREARRRSIMEQIFGADAKRRRRARAEQELAALRADQVKERRNSFGRSTKTVCVRTCDGYYFPVNLPAGDHSAEAQAQACANQCPGTEIALFRQPGSSGTAADMISVADGRRYTQLENAFLYQQTFNANCACNHRLMRASATSQVNDVAGTATAKPVTTVAKRTGKPFWRPDAGADPETRANRRGGFDAALLAERSREQAPEQIAREGGIRVVGEAFLPAQ